MNKMNTQKGFSLVELMLVLTAIVILTAFVFNQYNKYQVSQKASEEAQNLTLAATGIKSLYTSGNFSTLNTETAAKAGFFPDSMSDVANGTVTSKIAGEVQVNGVTDPDAANTATGTAVAGSKYYAITYTAVPEEVCIKLAGAIGGNFPGLTIGTTRVKNTFSGESITELDEAAVVTNCRNGADVVSMTFVGN